MRPGTRHYVVTVENCLALGGHFYNRDNLGRTATSLIYQHFLGDILHNTEHSHAIFILLKLVHHYNGLYRQQDDFTSKVKDCKFPFNVHEYYSHYL
jgi:hypothetical protein